MVLSDQKTGMGNVITTPQMMSSPYELGMPMGSGNLSARQRAGSKSGKRGRPISAYPIPGSYPGHLSHISESIEST